MDDLLAEFEQPKERSQETKERRRRLIATAGIVALSVVALGSLTTGAVFRDTTSVDSANIVTGSVNLDTNPTTTVDFSATNMAPGDSAFAKVRIVNSGSLSLRYSGTGEATGTLGGQLDFSVYMLSSAGAACDAGALASATQLSAPGPVGAGPTKLFGDAAQHAQPGDQTLPAGAQDGLCVEATLPLPTGDAFQSTTTTLTLTFDAEQTANN